MPLRVFIFLLTLATVLPLLCAGSVFADGPAPLPGEAAIAQLDRAEALIAHEDASGRSAFAVLGVLTSADRAVLLDAITEAAELTDAASVAIDHAIEAIDATMDPDEALLERRFALAIERRELRLPLARARAATILASLQDDHRTRTALATTAINALHKVTLNGVAIDARGALIAGEALLLIDEPAKALASFDTVIERAASATETDHPSPMDLAEAMIGQALAMAQSEGDHAARMALSDSHTKAPFVAQGATNPLLSLLRADARVRLDRIAGKAPIGTEGYLETLETATIEGVYLALRKAVFDRLDRLWEEEAWTPVSAPPLALIVRARQLAGDDSTRATAIRTLERLLDRSDDLNDIELAEAQLALAKTIADDNPRQAALLLLEIAGADEPTLLAATALREAYAIGDGAEHTDLADSVTALFDRTIAVMIAQAPTEAQRQALWLRRAALFERVGNIDKAIAAYGQIPEDSSMFARAQRRAVSLAVGEALRLQTRDSALALLKRAESLEAQATDPVVRELLDAARIIALTTLGRFDEAIGVIEGLEKSAPGDGALATLALDGSLEPITALILDAELRGDAGAQRASAELLLHVVESDRAQALAPTRERRMAHGMALLFVGRPDAALPVFQYLLEERFDFRINVWRAEAFKAAGRDKAAFRLFQSVTEILESSGRTDDPDFWRCWSRMLEILAAQDEPGRNDEAIRVQINRLRLLDQELGGEPHRRRIEAVERTIKPTGE